MSPSHNSAAKLRIKIGTAKENPRKNNKFVKTYKKRFYVNLVDEKQKPRKQAASLLQTQGSACSCSSWVIWGINELMANWEKAQNGEPLDKIDPLK